MHTLVGLLIFLISVPTIKSGIISYTTYGNASLTTIIKNYDYYFGNLFKFNVPNDTVTSLWHFQLHATSSCPPTKLYIYLDYAGYPVVAPLNESFPDTVSMNRLTKTISISNTNGLGKSFSIQSIQFNLTSPAPGSWFATVFYLNTESAFSTDCIFFLTSNNINYVEKAITQLNNTKQALFVSVSSLAFQTFKYQTTSNCNDPITYNIYLNSSSQSCSLTALLSEWVMPNLDSYQDNDGYITCTQASAANCSLSIKLPLINAWYNLGVSSNCDYTVSLNSNSSGTTVLIKTLKSMSQSMFSSNYYLSNNSNNELLLSTDSTPYFIEFIVDESNNGGTLNLNLWHKALSNSSSQLNFKTQLNGCLMFNALNNYISCPQGYSFNGLSNLTAFSTFKLNIPYPMIGRWYLALWRECLSLTTNQSAPCPSSYATLTIVNASTSQCFNNCANHGSCKVLVSQSNYFGVCECSPGYQGYGCTEFNNSTITNNNYIATVDGQIEQVLFLTLSNLVFLLPVLLALNRRWYIESLIYFYNMFFSAFYHACDQKVFYKCILHYDGLQLADFISSYSSFTVTLLSMSEVSRPWKVFTYVLSVLVNLSINLYDRFEETAFIIVIAMASCFTIATWANIWCKTHRLFPSKKRLLTYVPGLVLAITGILIYNKLQTKSNYWILHSIWHMVMALSILFFMPFCEVNTLLADLNRVKFFNFLKKFFPKNNRRIQPLSKQNSKIAIQTCSSSDLAEINRHRSRAFQIKIIDSLTLIEN